MQNLRLVLFSTLLCGIISAPIETKFELKCGYSKCPKFDDSKINVHIIAQTHDDVGWRKTVDQYYYTEVQYILDSVVAELHKDPNKKFIYVEVAFFWRWWQEQDQNTRKIVEGLVQNGQLEFIGGGWSMNDEATTYYHQIIDQMTWGFRRLNDTFGECSIPRIGWQIDPFGHSKEQASLFAQMNFDAFFFTRLDYQDRAVRQKTNTLEFVWRGNEELGKSSDIFTSILQLGVGYGSPPGFCWDLVHCSNDTINNPFIDDPESEDYNVKQKVNDFLIYAALFSQHYTTNHIYVTIGSDFQFGDAQSYFKNIDKLIKYVNERQNNGSKFNVFYSTPSCYLNAVHLANKTYTSKTEDFFPYGSDEHSFWTGYFTSRPSLKLHDRRANNFLQACKQLNVLAQLKQDNATIRLKEALAVNQHHDAVSGTEKQQVTLDYQLQLSKGVDQCEPVIQKAFGKLLPKKSSDKILEQEFCQKLNISFCNITEFYDKVAVTFYNPLARNVEYYFRLPVVGDVFEVFNSSLQPVMFDLLTIPEFIKQIPDRKLGTDSIANAELVFKVNLPPLGYSTYFVKNITCNCTSTVKPEPEVSAPFTLKGKSISVQFDSDGTLQSVQLENGQVVSLKQSFRYYESVALDNKGAINRSSGAYVFRNNGAPIILGHDITTNLTKGSVVQEVRQNVAQWGVSQTIRVYPNEDYIEFDWVIGPIPKEDDIGKEVIIRFDSNLTTNQLFYTDANGRQILERKLNYNPTFNRTITESVSENYYPVNSRIYVKDVSKDLQLTLVTDRSEGGSSLTEGSIELMLHRRIFHDDDFGVHENLDEPGYDYSGLVVRGKTVLYLSKIDKAAKFHRDIAQRINLAPIPLFAAYSSSESDYASIYNTMGSTVNAALPDNVHLLTLEEWKDGSVLLRLEHFYSGKDDPNGLSKNATVDLSQLFKPFTIKSVSETSLGANQYLDKASKRFEFRSDIVSNEQSNSEFHSAVVTLTPLQIRTFIVLIA